LGTPGGDAGEFILALHVYENYIGKYLQYNMLYMLIYMMRYNDKF
jgi:hypothetical protein